jgi:hypothetical protein
LETAKSQLESDQEGMVDDPRQRWLFLLKSATLEAPSLLPSYDIKPVHHLGIECVINNGPVGYKYKVDDTPDVRKAYQHCFGLGLWHLWLLWPGDSP